MNMTKNILLLGRIEILLDDMEQQLRMPDIQLFDGTKVEDVRSVFAQANIDHVFIGAGIDLEIRLEMIREIFQLSDTTTVHMKDKISGPQGFVPFVRSVLGGLKDYEM